MIIRIVISLGWFIFALALVYWFVSDQSGDPADAQEYVVRTKYFLTIAMGIILGGYALKYLGHMIGIGRYDRCQRCRKKIDKGEMFCFDHSRDAIWEAQERHRVERSE